MEGQKKDKEKDRKVGSVRWVESKRERISSRIREAKSKMIRILKRGR